MPKKLKPKIPSLTIAIPAYNEEESLALVLENIVENAPLHLSDYEVIIVDDGSTDKTGEIADQFAKKNKNIRVIHQKNQGYSRAMLKGIKEAKKEFVAYMPADGQFFLTDIASCFSLMTSADLILGYRGSRSDYTLYRLLLSYSYLLLLRLFFNLKYIDVNWFNLWRTKPVQSLKISSRSVFLLAEIAIRFRQKDLRVVEVLIPYRQRYAGIAKNASFKVAWTTFVDMLKFKILTPPGWT